MPLILFLVFVVFVILKAAVVIAWSWWLICIPLYLMVVLWLLQAMIVLSLFSTFFGIFNQASRSARTRSRR